MQERPTRRSRQISCAVTLCAPLPPLLHSVACRRRVRTHRIPESSRRYRRETGEGGCWGPSARYRGQPDCRLGQQWCTARVASSRGHDPERMVPSTRPGRMFGGEVRYELWAHGCCSRPALQGVTRAFPTAPMQSTTNGKPPVAARRDTPRSTLYQPPRRVDCVDYCPRTQTLA
jgi:hypothetical protein